MIRSLYGHLQKKILEKSNISVRSERPVFIGSYKKEKAIEMTSQCKLDTEPTG